MNSKIYQTDKNGFPKIKVLMRTYGEHKKLTEESIYSFLKQSYKNKELIIFNTHKDPLVLNKEYNNIKIINKSEGFDNLSVKTQYLIEQVKTGLFCILDDDDIILQYHLHSLYSIWKNNKKDNQIGMYSPGKFIYYNVSRDNVTEKKYNCWCCFLYDIYDGVEFYKGIKPLSKYQYPSGQDGCFLGLCKKMGMHRFNDSNFFPSYIYRWGTGTSHISGKGKISFSLQFDFIKQINNRKIKDIFKPHWEEDYNFIFEKYISSDRIFGGNGISQDDWIFIKDFLITQDSSNIAEFGSGISTVLFKLLGCDILSFETMEAIMNKIKNIINVQCYKWNGKGVVNIPNKYNIAFIDGPYGGENRKFSYESVLKSNVNYVICHDIDRECDKANILKYFSNWELIQKNRKTGIYKRK